MITVTKIQTIQIQREIAQLGKEMGFSVKIEATSNKTEGEYAPIVDVAWFIDLSRFFDIEFINPLFKDTTNSIDMSRIPFAGFEIEGSTTSSKNQVSNIANLYCGNFLYNFVIVNNETARNENDTYRRGVRITRYFNEMCGHRNVFFCDWIHFQESITKLQTPLNKLSYHHCEYSLGRSTFGGETTSVEVFDKLIPILARSGLKILQNYEPDYLRWKFCINQYMSSLIDSNNEIVEFFLLSKSYPQPNRINTKALKKSRDAFYTPKIDLVAGIDCPDSFLKWLIQLGIALKNDVVFYPLLFYLLNSIDNTNIYLPLLGIEVETGAGKHMNGGIINLSKSCLYGLVIAPSLARSHIIHYSNQLGCSNVSFCDISLFQSEEPK